jgi:uncharacterized protein (TIGR02118 family)
MPRQASLNVLTVARLLLCLSTIVAATVMSTAVAQEKPTASAESMAKLIVFYRTPRDPAEFDRYYAQVHIPLAKKIPGLRRLEVTRVTGAPSGATELYLIAELYFDNAAAREAALASNEAKATEADLSKFAEGIVTVYFGMGREP